jgi:tRNA1Val (adenine37-N6)-methyltransferase
MTEAVAGRDETLDFLCEDRLKLIQRRDGYRFSIDAILLANFVTLKKHERLLDVGSGCGIIPIYLSKQGFENKMIGVEIQKDLFDLSLRNKTVNGCDNIDFINGDIVSYVGHFKKAPFHVVISNPPYTKEKSGRKSPHHSRLLARYETSLDLERLISVSSSLLFKKGRFYIIYPARRLGELIYSARSGKLELKRVRFIYPKKNEEANLFLAEFIKEGGIGTTIQQPLYIYENSSYTDEVKGYYTSQG